MISLFHPCRKCKNYGEISDGIDTDSICKEGMSMGAVEYGYSCDKRVII